MISLPLTSVVIYLSATLLYYRINVDLLDLVALLLWRVCIDKAAKSSILLYAFAQATQSFQTQHLIGNGRLCPRLQSCWPPLRLQKRWTCSISGSMRKWRTVNNPVSRWVLCMTNNSSGPKALAMPMSRKNGRLRPTIYRIASMLKLFTSLALLQLCAMRAKLQLDDPLIKHLPWFTIQHRFADAPAHYLNTCSPTPAASRVNDSPIGRTTIFPSSTPSRPTCRNRKRLQRNRGSRQPMGLTLLGEVVGTPYRDALGGLYRAKHPPAAGDGKYAARTIARPPATGDGLWAPVARPGPRHRPASFADCLANMASCVEKISPSSPCCSCARGHGRTANFNGGTLREMPARPLTNPIGRRGVGWGFMSGVCTAKRWPVMAARLQGYRSDFQVCLKIK